MTKVRIADGSVVEMFLDAESFFNHRVTDGFFYLTTAGGERDVLKVPIQKFDKVFGGCSKEFMDDVALWLIRAFCAACAMCEDGVVNPNKYIDDVLMILSMQVHKGSKI